MLQAYIVMQKILPRADLYYGEGGIGEIIYFYYYNNERRYEYDTKL